MRVERIPKNEAKPWLLLRHYARRMPPISHAFALLDGRETVGVVTYGLPASPHLCRGVCGEDMTDRVIELNRLCVKSDAKNASSMLVGRSLQMLPKPSICISYADTGQSHVGYIYQATNWIYTGETGEKRDKVIAEGNVHSRHNKPSDREGEWRYEIRTNKHRYVFFTGSKTERKRMRDKLNYPEQPYPKGVSERYDADAEFAAQASLFEC